MSTTIVISDDEDEDKRTSSTAAHALYDNTKIASVQPLNGPSSGPNPYTLGRTSQTPLDHVFSRSFKQSSVSVTVRQVTDPTSAAPKSVPPSSQHSPAISGRWPSARRELPGQESLRAVEVIDLTGENTSGESQLKSDQCRILETAQTRGHPPQRRAGIVTTAENVSDTPARTNIWEIPRICISTSQIDNLHSEAGTPRRLSGASNREAEKRLTPTLQGGEITSPDYLRKPFRPRRAIPWSLEEKAAVTNHGVKPSIRLTKTSPYRDSTKSRCCSESIFQDRRSDKVQCVSAMGSNGNLKRVRKEDNASQALQNHVRPRLKLNRPNGNTSQQQDLVPADHHCSRAENMRGQLVEKGIACIGRRMTGFDQGTSPTLSTDIQQTQLTESDSDDASVRMLRSINQASAMYNKESSVNAESPERVPEDEESQIIPQKTEKEATRKRQSMEPTGALGSPELGESLPVGCELDNMSLESENSLRHETDAIDLALQPERLAAPDDVLHNTGLQSSSSSAHILTTKAALKELAVVEVQQSPTDKKTPVWGPSASDERGDISPDIKLLESIFKPLVEEMRAAQEYLMAGILARARKDAVECPGPDIDHSLPDPFAVTATTSHTQTPPCKPLRRVQMESRVVNVRSRPPPIELQAVPFRSNTQRLPKYNSIVRLGSNVLAPNDQDLRYLPYFPSEEDKEGVDAAANKRREELLEGFDNRIKFLPEEKKCAEQAEFWREHVEYFLEEIGCTCVDIIYYLLQDEDAKRELDCQLSAEALSQWQKRETCCGACGTKIKGDNWDRLSKTLSASKPDEKKLALAGLVCLVFSNMAKFSIWHIVSTDEVILSLLQETEKRWTAEQEPEGSRAQTLCMLCHVFDCPTHGAYLEDDPQSGSSDSGSAHTQEADQHSGSVSSDDVEARYNIRQTVALPDSPIHERREHTCGFYCVDPQTRIVDILGLYKNGEVKGSYNNSEKEDPGDPGFADMETCSVSCFWDITDRPERSIAEDMHSDSNKRFNDWSQLEVILYKSMFATCVRLRRGPCIMAIKLAKPCNVIFMEMLLDIHIIPHPVSEIETHESRLSLAGLTYSFKDKHYWSESSHTYDHHKRRPFVPCSHSGLCQKNLDCTCWTSKVACEWICGCDRACSRRFQGCRCIARGAKVCFKDSNCDCWVLNRECDPWLCGKCGVLEVLDPVNRHDDMVLNGRCKNAMIQRNIPKRTLKGPSEVHGWGLFAGTNIRANEFIGEYKGEVISKEESNRRGLVYHYRGIEYLFRLNKEQEIDSSRMGNKMRFINNSERPSTINVYAQTMFCNGVQRIGLFAKRNLVAGEEMFFRYGYPESVTKHFWEKEDLEKGRRSNSDEELSNNTVREAKSIKAKAVKVSVIAGREKTKKGVGIRIRKALPKSNTKEKHARFLDDIADDEPETSTSHHHHRPMKRKRLVSEESTSDLPHDDPDLDKIPTSDPAGPSSSSIGARTVPAESDTPDDDDDDDDEYEDSDGDHSSSSDDDVDSPVASELEIDVADDQNTHSSTAPSSRRSLQTAAARTASRRRAAKAKKGPARLGAAAAAAGGSTTSSLITTSTDGAAVGKKRGRPLGWKKGVHFK